MLLIPISNSLDAIAEFHQSAFVDFPVWALLYDGLEVDPFNMHGENIRSLRALGMDESSWKEWFYKLVMSQHTGLRLQSEGLAAFTKSRKSGVNTIPFIINGMRGAESAQMQDSDALFEKYYSLVSRLSASSVSSLSQGGANDMNGSNLERHTPVDFWNGSQAIKNELDRLWTSYRSEATRRVHHAHDLHRLLVEDNDVASDINRVLKDALGGQERLLLFNFVNYMSNVFTIVGSSIVIGLKPSDVSKPFPIQTVKELLAEATHTLIASTH